MIAPKFTGMIFGAALAACTQPLQDSAPKIGACGSASNPEAATERLSAAETTRPCRLAAIERLREVFTVRAVEALLKNLEFPREEIVVRKEGVVTLSGRDIGLGGYPAASALVLMGRKRPELVVPMLRAALRDGDLSPAAISKGTYALNLIYIEDPALAVAALHQEAQAAVRPGRRSALEEIAQGWVTRCPPDDQAKCRAALVTR